MNTTNIFTDKFNEFKTSNEFNRLEKKFEPKPYFKRFKLLRWLAFFTSYVFNIFSGLTASTLVFLFAYELTGFLIPSIISTLVFLIILEISKRLTIAPLIKERLQFRTINYPLLGVAIMLSGMSVSFSYFGSKQAVSTLTLPPKVKNIANELKPVSLQIDSLNLEIKEARNTKWKGTTTPTSQRTIESLTAQKTVLNKELIRMKKDANKANERIVKTHGNNTVINSNYFALVTLLFELLFFLTAFYLEFYDYRSFAEFSKVETKPNTKPKTTNSKPKIQTSVAISAKADETKPEKILQPKNGNNRNCLNCNSSIQHKRKDAKFCDEVCRREAWTKKNGREPYLRPNKK